MLFFNFLLFCIHLFVIIFVVTLFAKEVKINNKPFLIFIKSKITDIIIMIVLLFLFIKIYLI